MGGFFKGRGNKNSAQDHTTTSSESTATSTGRSDVKAAGAPKPNDQTTTDRTTNQTNPNDRSKSMRLSKNTPSKPEEEDFDIPSETVIPSFSSSTMSKGATSEVRSLGPSAIIGAKISFKGELTGEEDLLIEGNVEGTIELKNHHLTIGKQGRIKADINAKSITVEGTVEGDLNAVERISIKASSCLTGNVTADRVTLEDGAKFRGSIEMDTKSASTKSTPSYGSTSQPQTEKANG